jgi:hypothetical protein
VADFGNHLSDGSGLLEARWAPDGAFDLEDPPPEVLRGLENLALSDADLAALLGKGSDASVPDPRHDGLYLWLRLHRRVSVVVCQNAKLRAAVTAAAGTGSANVLQLLVSALGLDPGFAGARAIEPMAVGIALGGVGKLCAGAAQGR